MALFGVEIDFFFAFTLLLADCTLIKFYFLFENQQWGNTTRLGTKNKHKTILTCGNLFLASHLSGNHDLGSSVIVSDGDKVIVNDRDMETVIVNDLYMMVVIVRDKAIVSARHMVIVIGYDIIAHKVIVIARDMENEHEAESDHDMENDLDREMDVESVIGYVDVYHEDHNFLVSEDLDLDTEKKKRR